MLTSSQRGSERQIEENDLRCETFETIFRVHEGLVRKPFDVESRFPAVIPWVSATPRPHRRVDSLIDLGADVDRHLGSTKRERTYERSTKVNSQVQSDSRDDLPACSISATSSVAVSLAVSRTFDT